MDIITSAHNFLCRPLCQIVMCMHTNKDTQSHRSTLAGFTVVHQSVSSVTGALDQSSDHLTLLGATAIILVTVALAGARTCTPHGNILGT